MLYAPAAEAEKRLRTRQDLDHLRAVEQWGEALNVYSAGNPLEGFLAAE